jgi:hypothetical protein
VLAWIASVNDVDLRVSAVTIGEIQAGDGIDIGAHIQDSHPQVPVS